MIVRRRPLGIVLITAVYLVAPVLNVIQAAVTAAQSMTEVYGRMVEGFGVVIVPLRDGHAGLAVREIERRPQERECDR